MSGSGTWTSTTTNSTAGQFYTTIPTNTNTFLWNGGLTTNIFSTTSITVFSVETQTPKPHVIQEMI